ncbi:glycoside hydrolase family 2 TIM barrel-domain containing protein [Granulicella tundricola]|uniref:Glycoside hydrolase family 2 sugar binding protein n=1 Tax=Granulicella tundricola (strain ATCC BAA-1859 / DSM 23138 / MP5ACTX9) TaxID=1198114 RepID=E8X5X4_GRATM|nr:glycoside hydrolase family 2 TIM barrel-domain containing protein [Granulicella tundricola]ADW70858.1 glycoside hydrolase family 2 sugar binding protein [Granulicella tundricola MP5ACTX9]
MPHSLTRSVSRRLAWAAIVLVSALSAQGQRRVSAGVSCGRQEVLLDTDWRFHLGDAAGSEQPSASDSVDWQPVTLPHDWAIHGPRLVTNLSGGAGGFAPMGIGWYRRHIPSPTTACAGRALVQFDGIMANSDVWLNGHLLGHRPNGYVSLVYDLTPFLNATPGADNLLLVKADNSQQPASRFYQGAGIYRHVHLIHVPELHLETWGTAIATPHIMPVSAEVSVSAEVRNDASQSRTATVRVTILDASGHRVAQASSIAQAVAAGAVHSFAVTLNVSHPRLWDVKDPNLYQAKVEVLQTGQPGDLQVSTFGIRDAHFDAATGFSLNGRTVKIKGVALHSDIGALGMAVPLSLWEHRLRAMQHMGANAIRTAHNPVAPEFLDLCDRMGFLVLDEFFDVWTVGKNPYDYHLNFRDWYLRDTRDSVRRDRNHPSIIAWSAGNEIHDTPHPDVAKPILASLIAEYHKDDPTRPVTQALFRPNASHDYEDGLADMLDVIGQNYRPGELLAAHEARPERKILGTENIHDRATWLAVRDNAAYAGMFLWSGTDYLGESRHWPLFADQSGMNDRTDFPKPDSLERESWWADRPVVHIVRRTARVPKAPTDPGYELDQYRPQQVTFPDWTPANREPHPEQVEVYSNCREVALSLNGQSLGAKTLPPDASARGWQVTFEAGLLKARCTDQPGVEETLTTAGTPAGLSLTAESKQLGTTFDDVTEVRLTVVDAHGTPVPGVAVPVTFSVAGDGTLLATDDADPTYTAAFENPTRTTLDGRAVAFIRGNGGGTLTLQATSPGLAATNLRFMPPNASAALALKGHR